MTELSGIMRVIEGDITALEVDAIVNAANSALAGGGGVDGAIHRAAGPELLAACRKLGGCPTGEARITEGYRLKARWVIHAVGPVWHGGSRREAELLASAYTNSMRLALEAGAGTVAFPAISTGVYRFPKEAAARIAVEAVGGFIDEHPFFDQVLFTCFSPESARLHERALAAYLSEQGE